VTDTRSTKRQRELLNFVDTFIQGHGYGPSYREIMRALGYKSVSTVAIHIDGLITKGYLRKRDNSARSLEVVTVKFDADTAKKTPTAAQEKWLVTAINERFTSYEVSTSTKILDELYVLVGALKILGLDDSYMALMTKLQEVVK
jgi:SOS-response transcriptional repressor LexA